MSRSDRTGDRSEDGNTHGHGTSVPRDSDHAVLSGSSIVTGSRTITERVATWTRSSALYGWLTAEPDPNVIVIDLRETRTVGPVIRVIDRMFATLAKSKSSSHVATGGHHLASAFRSRPLRFSGAAILVGSLTGLFGGVLTGTLSMAPAIGLLILAVLATIGVRSEMTLKELRETRLIATLAEAFEPPEPPSTDRSTDGQNEPDDEDGRETPDT